MSKRVSILVVLFIFILALQGSSLSFLSYSNLGNAQSIAMGNISAALTNDVAFLNPSVLAFASSNRTSFSYGRIPGNINSYLVAFSHSLWNIGSFGLKVNVINAPVRNSNNNVSNFITGNYRIAFAKRVHDSLSIGFDIERLSRNGNNSLDSQAEGYSSSLGILYAFQPNFYFGLLLRDFISSKFKYSNGVEEEIPKGIATGFVYKPFSNFMFAMDYNKADINQDNPFYSVGMEWEFLHNLKVRSGYMVDEIQGDIGSLGFGITLFNRLLFDYAYQKEEKFNVGNHYVSISHEF